MKKQFIKHLPVILNGFAIGMLLPSIPKITILDIVAYFLAVISFFWYGKNN